MDALSPIDDEDRHALAALLRRYERVWQEKQLALSAYEEARMRLFDCEAQFDALRTAFIVFEVDLEAPEREGFRALRAILTDDVYDGIIGQVQGEFGAPPRRSKDAPLLESPKAAANLTVRELVLARLERAGSQGAKAREIRSFLALEHSLTVHDKTVGMTLYRLSKEGLARREGHKWFFVPGSETKNPGAATPGLSNVTDRKENA